MKSRIGPSNLTKLRFIAFDFDGVFTNNMVFVDENGKETVRCWRSDGIGLSKLKKIGIPHVVISTEKNPLVKKRCAKLKIPCYHGVSSKLPVLQACVKKYGVNASETAFVGNDINDLEVLNFVGIPIAVADAYPEVKKVACWHTKRPGGLGAVREICDAIVNSNR